MNYFMSSKIRNHKNRLWQSENRICIPHVFFKCTLKQLCRRHGYVFLLSTMEFMRQAIGQQAEIYFICSPIVISADNL
jgi:hypothetical protein